MKYIANKSMKYIANNIVHRDVQPSEEAAHGHEDKVIVVLCNDTTRILPA